MFICYFHLFTWLLSGFTRFLLHQMSVHPRIMRWSLQSGGQCLPAAQQHLVSAAMDKNKTWMLQPVEMATQKWITLFHLQQIQVSCTGTQDSLVEGGQPWGSWWRLHQIKDHGTSLSSHESTGCRKSISSVDAHIWLCSFLCQRVVPLPVSQGFLFFQWL